MVVDADADRCGFYCESGGGFAMDMCFVVAPCLNCKLLHLVIKMFKVVGFILFRSLGLDLVLVSCCECCSPERLMGKSVL